MDASDQDMKGVYALTAQGEHELRGGVTTLSPTSLETALKTDHPAADVPQQLAVLDRELGAMVAALAGQLQAQGQDGASPHSI